MNKKNYKMSNKTFFSGDAKQYAEWIKDNISEISSICGWGELVGTFKIEVYAGNGNEVARITILHANNDVTEILCEVNQHTIPLASILKTLFAIESTVKAKQLKNNGKYRWVVAAPLIDEVIIRTVQNEKLPIHFLQANPDECKYWASIPNKIWE